VALLRAADCSVAEFLGGSTAPIVYRNSDDPPAIKGAAPKRLVVAGEMLNECHQFTADWDGQTATIFGVRYRAVADWFMQDCIGFELIGLDEMDEAERVSAIDAATASFRYGAA
jgi:hypothetical protein